MRMSRHVVQVVLAVAVGGAVAGGVTGCASGAAEHLDPSGLVVVSESRDGVVPEQLRDAYAAYDLLTEANPDDFGFASPAIEGVTVTVGTTSARGRELLTAFSTGSPAVTSASAQALTSAAEQAIGLRAVAVPVTTSRREVEALRDELIGWSRDPRFADAGIRSTAVERSSGAALLGVERLTPALATALVDAYGADAVVVLEGGADLPEMTAGSGALP
ncbi:hypothetical protein LJR027_000438 [Terrabacter sp. LjRoot27]|jgi:hypothetical protein|uniref:hypothetical protein n=1 Tax=Terrabacter sp. LjRoot27 TaxID=3342306 RepID=UPI003ECD236B